MCPILRRLELSRIPKLDQIRWTEGLRSDIQTPAVYIKYMFFSTPKICGKLSISGCGQRCFAGGGHGSCHPTGDLADHRDVVAEGLAVAVLVLDRTTRGFDWCKRKDKKCYSAATRKLYAQNPSHRRSSAEE